MANNRNKKMELAQPVVYQIQIAGQLGGEWSGWFDGLAITLTAQGDTLLTGPIVDQAALYGLLKKVRDLGIPLVAVLPLQPVQAAAAACQETDQSQAKKESSI